MMDIRPSILLLIGSFLLLKIRLVSASYQVAIRGRNHVVKFFYVNGDLNTEGRICGHNLDNKGCKQLCQITNKSGGTAGVLMDNEKYDFHLASTTKQYLHCGSGCPAKCNTIKAAVKGIAACPKVNTAYKYATCQCDNLFRLYTQQDEAAEDSTSVTVNLSYSVLKGYGCHCLYRATSDTCNSLCQQLGYSSGEKNNEKPSKESQLRVEEVGCVSCKGVFQSRSSCREVDLPQHERNSTASFMAKKRNFCQCYRKRSSPSVLSTEPLGDDLTISSTLQPQDFENYDAVNIPEIAPDSSFSVYLSNGWTGVVNLTRDSTAGYVCADDWDSTSCKSVCHHLGFKGGMANKTKLVTESSPDSKSMPSTSIRWRDLKCTTNDTLLRDCFMEELEPQETCDSDHIAACHCQEMEVGEKIQTNSHTEYELQHKNKLCAANTKNHFYHHIVASLQQCSQICDLDLACLMFGFDINSKLDGSGSIHSCHIISDPHCYLMDYKGGYLFVKGSNIKVDEVNGIKGIVTIVIGVLLAVVIVTGCIILLYVHRRLKRIQKTLKSTSSEKTSTTNGKETNQKVKFLKRHSVCRNSDLISNTYYESSAGVHGNSSSQQGTSNTFSGDNVYCDADPLQMYEEIQM